MCLVLPARVVSVNGATAEVLLYGEQQAVTAGTQLTPDVRPGNFALIDRGVILRVIEPEEAEAILAIYAEMGDLLDQEDLRLADPPQAQDDINRPPILDPHPPILSR